VTATSNPGAAPAARQFDFWLGDWDLTWDGGHGTNRIRSVLGGRVIEEQFHSADMTLDGMSVSVYDEALDRWQQTWVDSQGSYIHLTGGWQGDRMELRAERLRGGRVVLLRMVFDQIAADRLEWSWERSEDAGQTWSPLWQIHYQRSTSR
jgi:hypothetical protein